MVRHTENHHERPWIPVAIVVAGLSLQQLQAWDFSQPADSAAAEYFNVARARRSSGAGEHPLTFVPTTSAG